MFFTNSSTNAFSGNVYRQGSNNRAFLLHHNGTNEISIGTSTTLANNVFAVDADNGQSRLAGRLNFNGAGNTKIQAEGDEMLWYDNTSGRASWGYGAALNKFQRPIVIGTTLVPTSGQSLVIADAKAIAMVGNNSFIQWFASTRSDHTGASAGFVGVNSGGAMFVESNLSKVTLDGETGIDIRGSDVIRARMNSSGNWVFGGTVIDPNFRMCIEGDLKVEGLCVQDDIKLFGEIFVASDVRLKKNIQALGGGLKTLLSLNPVTYKFKADEFKSLEAQTDVHMGFLAQEVKTCYQNWYRLARLKAINREIHFMRKV